MRLLTVLLLALVGALALTTTATAQTPSPTATVQPVPTFPTGSISGRIIIEGPGTFSIPITVLPATVTQPVPYSVARNYFSSTDLAGNFTVTGLADGEYLIAVGSRGETFSSSDLTETVTFIDVDTFSLPALRVTVSGGQAVTGIVITLVYPTPPLVVDDFGVPLSGVAGLPSTGGGSSGGGAADYIGAAVAGLAALAFVGGVLWRLRGARR